MNATVTPLIHPNNTPELTQPAQHHTSNASPPQLNNPPPKIIDPPVNPNPVSTHTIVTCFRVETNRPTQRLTLHVSPISPLPKSYADAFNDPNWQNAMQDEYNALIKNNFWTPVPRPMDAYFVRCMWLFRHKYLAYGTLSRYKAHLVANGSTRIERKYAIEILERAYMGNCNPSRTLVDTESKLEDDGEPVFDPTLYWSLAGSLQYLTFTRPKISYAEQQVCLYMHDPRKRHFSALKRILRYVRGTLGYGLQFSSSTTSLVAYSDADWTSCPTTRRSTSGFCVFLRNNLLSWSSKCQPTLSRSSEEAEYRGVANVVAETCWLRNLLRKLHTPLSSATLVYCDNVSVVYLYYNSVQHQRTKHIEIDIHFVRDLVAAGQVRVLHVPSRYQYADIFTKGLPSALFEAFRTSLSVRWPTRSNYGGVLVISRWILVGY
ncbi:ribonuclease H-like domain-containing protein [Tanacetum coccineum]